MPKNALSRLQKIHDDLKTVISIYDITKSPEGDNENKNSKLSSKQVPKEVGNVYGNRLDKTSTGEVDKVAVSTPKTNGNSKVRSILPLNHKYPSTLLNPASSKSHPIKKIVKPKISNLSTPLTFGHNFNQKSDVPVILKKKITTIKKKPDTQNSSTTSVSSVDEEPDSKKSNTLKGITPSKKQVILKNEDNFPQKNVHTKQKTNSEERPCSTESTKTTNIPKETKLPDTKEEFLLNLIGPDTVNITPTRTRSESVRKAPEKIFGHIISPITENLMQDITIETDKQSYVKPETPNIISRPEEPTLDAVVETPKQNSNNTQNENKTEEVMACEDNLNDATTKNEETEDLNIQDIFNKNLVNPELENKLREILGKNNEKYEKMKASKDLVMQIAKRLKTKFEEAKESRIELIIQLQKLEKENERLCKAINDEKTSCQILQTQLDEIKKNSQTVLEEKNCKTKLIMDENLWLRAKLEETEKQYNEELTIRQNIIDQLQKERIQLEVSSGLENKNVQVEKKLEQLINQKNELLNDSEELIYSVSTKQLKINILESKINDLEDELRREKQNAKKKEETLEATNKELEMIRQNSNLLEEQVKTLRKSVDSFDDIHKKIMQQTTEYENHIKANEEKMKKLEEENQNLKKELENDKDALLIKHKIIDDLQETIKKLRDNSDETKMLIKKNQSLERLLNIERDEKIELQEAVERLKWRKEELKKKIKTLEEDLLIAPQEVVRDLQKTQVVLHELENQVQVKQKEWAFQLQSLLREKKQACNIAEYATKKLLQTTSEFQKQSEAQKVLHKILKENLEEKDQRKIEKKKDFQFKKIIPYHIDQISKCHRSMNKLWADEGISSRDNQNPRSRRFPYCITSREDKSLFLPKI